MINLYGPAEKIAELSEHDDYEGIGCLRYIVTDGSAMFCTYDADHDGRHRAVGTVGWVAAEWDEEDSRVMSKEMQEMFHQAAHDWARDGRPNL